MKVRVGVGAGAGVGQTAAQLGEIVDAMEDSELDSLWLSEVLTSPVIDPLVGLSWAAARSQRMKLGTTMVMPGRNLVRLAKQLAALDRLSGGRLLVTFVPGLGQDPERAAIGLTAGRRNAAIEEVLPLLRRLWSGETVTYHGESAHFEGVTLSPLPHQQPLEAWLGGMAPAALDRCGRLGDGWLPSLCTPQEAAEGKRVIDETADRAERAISPEHFGVSLGYTLTPLEDRTVAVLARRARGHDPRTLVPLGFDELRQHLERFIDCGFSKFVVRPLTPPQSWRTELDGIAGAVGDLQS